MKRKILFTGLFLLLPVFFHLANAGEDPSCSECKSFQNATPAAIAGLSGVIRKINPAIDTTTCSRNIDTQHQLAPAQGCQYQVKWADLHRGMTRQQMQNEVVKNLQEESGNLGGGKFEFKFKDGSSRKVNIFRSAFLGAGDQGRRCLAELMKHHGVKHVVNMYTPEKGAFRDAKTRWEPAEKKIAQQHNASYQTFDAFDYRHVDDVADPGVKLRKGDVALTKRFEQIDKIFGSIIGQVKLSKAGADSKDISILIHCMGGMHRTGIMFGLLRKCINGEKLDAIIDEAGCHMAKSPGNKGGFKPEVVNVIRKYDCKRIKALTE
ncbi:MAG: hypothetical protein A2583_14040 [Bdellovibrionales bacterium RIFOXYD1_FULL_53_11]|nr:MAG: hypothetical protein A2583_14040 [Bdellovibrionales bacterium RIFOXYD1_FULL_53_11]